MLVFTIGTYRITLDVEQARADDARAAAEFARETLAQQIEAERQSARERSALSAPFFPR